MRARFALALLWSAIAVAFSRSFRGPGRPRWSFAFEVMVAAMRRFSRSLAGKPMPEQRRAWESISAPAARGVERRPLSAPDAEWLIPRVVGRPTILWIHGGAFCWGSSRTHAEMVSRIAVASRARALVPNYRLAPEHPHPAAIEDVVAVYRWLVGSGTPPEDVVIAGDSAGANLALQLALTLAREGAPQPRGLVLVCPWVDLARQGGSIETNLASDWGAAGVFDRWAREYAGDRPLRDPAISPLFADLRGLPPALIQAGGAEMILDQAVALGEALRAAGVPCALRVHEDMVHNWHALTGPMPEYHGAVIEIGRFVMDPRKVTS